MTKLSKNQWLGIILILAAILIWAPIPFVPFKESLGAIAVILVGAYELFFR
jgi:hypothetical protein